MKKIFIILFLLPFFSKGQGTIVDSVGNIVSTNRGINSSELWTKLTSTYTLSNATGVQKLFNTGASNGGALTVSAGTHYFFECGFSLSSMSATSGNAAFSLAGTATLTSVHFWNVGVDATTQTTVAATNGAYASTAATAASAQTAGTGTGMWTFVKGEITVNAGGTIIPSINQVTAAAAVVGIGSYFRIWAVGPSSVTYVGQWN